MNPINRFQPLSFEYDGGHEHVAAVVCEPLMAHQRLLLITQANEFG